ncbi:AcrR family transcriptional regulator [Thermocatellispora tengchongensis]|uniref:AcrR family transcriptional regulator n=1 Tax=Thermocatellispora tengchongensis TaxID=1073253 RepID=A0A840PIQ1_9ACTN|nr:TetR/AcrR family transcriptional regulator C-terminal domain-containing protein [Thermocatellispora tengchongensis]MBB5138746.1 AcrR family transcriptional regulator [Thermocatellispora tengchongensis]
MRARHDSGDGEPMLIWERPEPPSRPAPSPLSRERIVRAAIDLADAEGLDAVSLRKVAAALNAGPMRLYGYLSTKQELLDLMVDEVYGEIMAPGPAAEDWRAALRDLAHRTRSAALRHEWFADLLGSRPNLGPNALAFLDASFAALHRAPGLTSLDAALHAGGTVTAYVIGAVRREITELRAERASGMDKTQWQRASGPYLTRMLATGRYPALERAIQADDFPPDPATAFASGLECVLDGIASRVSPES